MLYAETNYILGYAKGQDPFAAGFVQSAELWPFRLAIPEVCVMEALSAFKAEIKSRNEILSRLRSQLRETKRDRTSSHARALESHLEKADVAAENLLRDVRNRLDLCIHQLVASHEVFPLKPEVICRSIHSPIIEDPTDNLILHGIIGHAQSGPPGPRAFLSGNRNDFGQPEALEELKASGILYFSDSRAAAEWFSHQADSGIGGESGDRI